MYYNPIPNYNVQISRKFKEVDIDLGVIPANSSINSSVKAPSGKLWLVKFMAINIEGGTDGYVALNWRLGSENAINDFVHITSDPDDQSIIQLRPSGFLRGRIERPYQFSDKKATQLLEHFDSVAVIGEDQSRFTITNNTNEDIEQPIVKLYVVEEG